MSETGKTESPEIYVIRIYRWRMAFFSLVILLAGLVIGAASTMVLLQDRIMPPPGRARVEIERMMRRLEHRLDLSPEQTEQLQPIVQKYMEKLHELRETARQNVDEQLVLMNEEISSVLNDDQKQRWEHHLQQLRERMPPRRHHRGPGPHGRGPWGEGKRREQRRQRRGWAEP